MDTYQCKYDDWMKSNSSKAVQEYNGLKEVFLWLRRIHLVYLF